MAEQYSRLDNLETFHQEQLERLDKIQQTFS